MKIIFDSDGIIGNLDPTDAHHATSRTILEKLTAQGADFIYPATTIAEVLTFFKMRLKPEIAEGFTKLIKEGKITVEPVDSQFLQEALPLYSARDSRHHTLFDAIVAAVAKKYNADAIFSFDKFYKTKGLKLASEL